MRYKFPKQEIFFLKIIVKNERFYSASQKMKIIQRSYSSVYEVTSDGNVSNFFCISLKQCYIKHIDFGNGVTDLLFTRQLVSLCCCYPNPFRGMGAWRKSSPRSWQLSRPWTGGRGETENCQRASGAKSP